MSKKNREKREFREKVISRSRLENIYFTIIEWGTYLVLFTPLILAKSYFFPFVVPKTTFFKIVVDIIFIAYLLLLASNSRYRPKLNLFNISFFIFLGILILTSFTGVNFERSFWSTFERMTGLLTFFHLFAFFIVLTSVFKERKYWERILSVAILVGVILCLYTFMSEDPSARGGGTLGNTSFLAACLLFSIFFSIILFFTKSGWWKVVYGGALLVLVAGLFISPEPCRGAIGAFFTGIFFLGLSYIILSRNKNLLKLIPLVLVLIGLISFGILQTNHFKGITSSFKDFSDNARGIVWKMSTDGWKEKMWLGWGIENFNTPFGKYFDPRLPLTGDVWYDRVHNIILDNLVTTGILGSISYFAVFLIAFFSLFKVSLRVTDKKNLLFPLGMISVLIVYIVQNIWVFDMISSYMLFFLSLAFINFLIQKKDSEEEQKETKTMGVYNILIYFLIIITIITFYFGNIQPARASNHTVLGLVYPLDKSITEFQKALSLSPISIFETPEQFSKKVTTSVGVENINQEVLKKAFESSSLELEKSVKKNPQDFRISLVLGRHYSDFYYVSQDPLKLKLAQEYLEKAIQLSPKNQQGYWALGQTKVFQQKNEECIELFKKALDLEPRYGQAHWYLAIAYKIAGDYEMALQELDNSLKFGFDWTADITNLKKGMEVYQELQKNEELVILYELGIKKSPKDATFKAGLAVAYANLGQFDKARALANEAISLDPSLKGQLEQFLSQLPQ